MHIEAAQLIPMLLELKQGLVLMAATWASWSYSIDGKWGGQVR